MRRGNRRRGRFIAPIAGSCGEGRFIAPIAGGVAGSCGKGRLIVSGAIGAGGMGLSISPIDGDAAGGSGGICRSTAVAVPPDALCQRRETTRPSFLACVIRRLIHLLKKIDNCFPMHCCAILIGCCLGNPEDYMRLNGSLMAFRYVVAFLSFAKVPQRAEPRVGAIPRDCPGPRLRSLGNPPRFPLLL